MANILYVATSDIHLHTFHRPYIDWLLEQGHKVDLAIERRGEYSFSGVNTVYEMPFPRSFTGDVLKGYKSLKSVIDNGNYQLIHCHTPIPSMLTRFAARHSRKRGTKLLYTAHGFHFFKGAPLKNWLIYYFAEYLLSGLTDGIITINKEDFDYINGKMLHNDSYYIKGIGVDAKTFKKMEDVDIYKNRERLGFGSNDFLLLYVAEFIPRKNHEFLIRLIPKLMHSVASFKFVFAGSGVLLQEMKLLAKDLGVEEYIYFLGFRTDVNILSAIVDVGISSSKHEGLGLGLAEEMMCGVPVVATVDRGHKEMIEHGVNGYFFEQQDQNSFIESITNLYNDRDLLKEMGLNALEKSKEFEVSNSLNSMKTIYNKYL